MADEHHRAAIAERAARSGGVVAREAFRGELRVETKANKNDFVTAADRDAQQQAVATIREEFPDDGFVCEEELVHLVGPESGDGGPSALDEVPESGTAWVIDPIDGTANFVRGNTTWATSVAATVDGSVVGSATYLPATGDLYAAGPESVTRDGNTIRVSDRSDPETFAVVPVGWWDRDDRSEFGALCSAIVDRFGDMRRIGSFQATLGLIADGGLDGAICTTPTYVWDTLAGVHMVREAGGAVTDLDGEPWTRDADVMVASNGAAHDALLAAAEETLD